MSWCEWFMHNSNVLEEFAAVPRHRWCTNEKIPQSQKCWGRNWSACNARFGLAQWTQFKFSYKAVSNMLMTFFVHAFSFPQNPSVQLKIINAIFNGIRYFFSFLLVLLWNHSGDRTTSPHNARRRYETPKRLELVHLDASPQYCERNLSIGSLGTVDRPCNHTARGLDSCDLLCCGRGHNIHQFNRKWKCRCKFKWCCEVNCSICIEKIEQYTCK